MTRAPRRATLSFADIDDVAAAIRAGGGRLSSACRAVLSALFAADGPISAEDIARGRGGAPDLSSVYRNLERLEELGVVRHLHVAHGPGLYALEGEAPREYLVCEHCDRVESVDAARLDPVRAAIRERFGYEVHFGHFPMVGVCRACAEEQGPGAEHGHVHHQRAGDPEHAH